MSAIFITGTGTDIGKTYLTKGLVSVLRSRGRPVLALKPVVSGFDPHNLIGSDPAVLLEAMERALCWEELERISPFRFFAPLSPDMAARIENKTIDFSAVCNFCQEAIRAYDGAVLIEGIGGILVPLSKTKTTLDLMINLHLPLILVAGTYLGSISHLLSALEVIVQHGLIPLAVVINETPGSNVPVEELLETLHGFVKVPLFFLRYKKDKANCEVFEDIINLGQI